jgi:hypothetical protein
MGLKRGRGTDLLAADQLYHKSLGAAQLTPQKFRRQLKTTVLTGPVEADYSFPTSFNGNGNQVFVDLKQNPGQYEGATLTTIEEELLAGQELVSYRRTNDAQVETLDEELVPETQAPPTLSALVTTMSQDALGNGKSLLTLGTVDSVFPNQRWEISRPRLTPSEFMALIPVQSFTETLAGAAGPVTLGPTQIEAFDEQIDVFRHRKKSGSLDFAILPVTITGSRTTKDKQVEHIEKTLEVDTTVPALPTALLDVSFLKLGDGTAVEEHDYVDFLFTRTTFDIEIPDVIPHKFKATVPTQTDAILSVGTASQPTLLTGELKRSSEQVNVFVKKDTVVFRNIATLPITLTEYKLTPKLQLATATATLAVGLQTITPSGLTIDAAVENLGNNTSLKTEETVPSLFTEPTFETTIPDLIPQKFRGVVPTHRTSLLSLGTATQPVLATGELSHVSDQINVFVKKDTSEFRDITVLPVSLTEYRMTPQKQTATTVATLATGLQTISPDELTIEASVDNLGNNSSLQTVSAVGSLFTEPSFSTEIPDPIPTKFRVTVPTLRTSVLSAGTAVQPTLATGQLRRTSEQVNVFVKRDTTEFRDITVLPVSLSESRMTPQKQIAAVVSTLAVGLQTITADALTVEATVDNLGNNTSLKTQAEVGSLFTEPSFSTEIPDRVPEKFRAVTPTLRTTILSVGTAAQPTLATGELRHVSDQINVFVKRDTSEFRDITALPVSLTDYRMTPQKQVATSVATLAVGLQTITPDGLTIEASVDNLGNNTSLKTVEAVGSLFPEPSFSAEIGDVIPLKYRVLIPTLRTSVLSLGTAAAPTLATGELRHTEEQLNVFVKRDTSEYRDPTALPVSLTEYRMTPQRQVSTVLTTLATGLQTISPDSLTVEASVDNLGSNLSLLSVGTVPTVFSNVRYSREVPDPVPVEFRSIVPDDTVEQTLAGNAAAAAYRVHHNQPCPTLHAPHIAADPRCNGIAGVRVWVAHDPPETD